METKIIRPGEFIRILNAITYANGALGVSRNIRNIYRPWLKTTFIVMYKSGIRLGDLIHLKHSDIIPSGDTYWFKSSRSLNRDTPLDRELLNILKWSPETVTDEYIIAPGTDRQFATRHAMMAFRHYSVIALGKKGCGVYDLRKSWIHNNYHNKK